MNEPRIARILVEYEDGSSDHIIFLPNPGLPVYSLDRGRAGEPVRKLGAHTTFAIAALLFRTAFTARRLEYSARDPEIAKLARVVEPTC